MKRISELNLLQKNIFQMLALLKKKKKKFFKAFQNLFHKANMNLISKMTKIAKEKQPIS